MVMIFSQYGFITLVTEKKKQETGALKMEQLVF